MPSKVCMRLLPCSCRLTVPRGADALNCYFVLDLMLGGDLRCEWCFPVCAALYESPVHRLRLGSLGEDAVRFYVAEISSALAYLHQNGICHRCAPPFPAPVR